MKKLRFIFVFFALFAVAITPLHANKDTESAKRLAQRLAPEYAANISFETIDAPDSTDVYEIEQNGPMLAIRGNNINSMAVGLGHYLKYYCNANISWYKDDPIALPAKMPVVDKKIRHSALVKNRFFLNYCTYGYTMPWWQWADWERLIDWMAIHGVTLPLAITGQEAVWRNVWQQIGLNPKEIDAYFTGPAHLPWHRMINMDRFQGNIPQSWHKHQADLQRHIVDRERELGMKPVLPAFAGHVPRALAEKFPDAKITKMTQWGEFRDEYRSYFLDPNDPLFPKIQKLFLDEQTRLYGTDHIYGLDPFNEVDPPSWEPEFLAKAGKHMYQTLQQADPDAVWLQMTWLFYYASKKWKPECIKAFITAVPSDRLILLDYYCDRAEVWKRTESYYGQPYIWCYLGNFGGNTMLAGDIRDTRTKIDNVLAKGGSNFSGIGSTLEGMDVNPLMYEYVFEKAWEGVPEDSLWIQAYADRRAGAPSEAGRRAWHGLYSDIYKRFATSGQGTLTNARPSLKGYGNKYTKALYNYDNDRLYKCWSDLLEAAGDNPSDAMTFDVVNVGRQVIGNHFWQLRDSLTAAYEAKDAARAKSYGTRMLTLLDDMDRLLSCHRTFLMGRWVDAAAAFGDNDTEKEYYRTNARTIVTTWGEAGQILNDYANRSWAGLTSQYYRPRWEMFITDINNALASGKEFDEDSFKTRCLEFETDFAFSPKPEGTFSSTANTDSAMTIARELARKYAPETWH